METSVLTSYSLGIAAENKPLNTRTLNVTPIEQLPALDGEISFNPQEKTTVGIDPSGNRHEVTVIEDMSITCEWIPYGSNRVTPPDVRRGEIIEILRLGDSDRYFWRSLGLRDNLRRLETVIYAFNANPNEGSNGIDFSNCYMFEVSTHTKLITLHTSKANGEPREITLQINAGEGRTVVTDDVGTFAELDFVNRSILAQNADKSFVHINRKKVHLQTPDKASVLLDRGKIDVDAPLGITLKTGGTTLDLKPNGTLLKTPSVDVNQS